MREFASMGMLNIDTKPLATDIEWSDAECKDADRNLFFSADGEHKARWRARQGFAKAICERCIIRDECLRHALTTGEVGIWGGTDDDERKDMLGAEIAS